MRKISASIMKVPVKVMVSSMETITKTMQEIQEMSAPPEVDDDLDDESEKGSRMAEVSKMAFMPFFAMLRLPMNLLASGLTSMSESIQEIKKAAQPGEEEEEEDLGKPIDKLIFPLSEEESALEAEASLDPKVAEDAASLWQIGRTGTVEYAGKWKETFTYKVGSSLDEVENPRSPLYINVEGAHKARGTTERLNLQFELERVDLGKNLALIYDRWGGEKDEVRLDGELVAPVSGAGIGRYKQVALLLGDIPNGEHTISLTTTGDEESEGHRIDFLKLVEIEESEAETEEG
ncbi:MAG: hypothetical protein ACI8UO_004865 [Verrucomicrobiales bacterium]|jgi:hypothetical protein